MELKSITDKEIAKRVYDYLMRISKLQNEISTSKPTAIKEWE